MMDEPARELFTALPISPNSTLDDLEENTALTSMQIHGALRRLITLSIVMMSGTLEEPRYRLHRLTETFLMNEVLKWQTPALPPDPTPEPATPIVLPDDTDTTDLAADASVNDVSVNGESVTDASVTEASAGDASAGDASASDGQKKN